MIKRKSPALLSGVETKALQASMGWHEFHLYQLAKRDWVQLHPTASSKKFKAACTLLSAEITSRIADEGNCYFSATGAEHGRALRGKPHD